MKFALDEQIASQVQAVQQVLERVESVPTLDIQRPIYFCGIGTSSHACRIAAHWVWILSGGKVQAMAISAYDMALHAPLSAQDQVVVVSHRGSKTYPRQALERARQVGASTLAIVGQDAPEQIADHTLRTCPGERSGTHTVSYVSGLSVLAQVVGKLLGEQGLPLLSELAHVPDALERTIAMPAPVGVAEQLAGREPLLLTGVGLDAITAQEAALKLKEGTYQWAEGMELEYALHGPPAAMRAGMGGIAIVPASEDGGRTQVLLDVWRTLDVQGFTCGEDSADLPFASVAPLVRPLVSIVPLQRLTAEIARIRQTNPDEIHRDAEPWNSAMNKIVL